MTLAEMKAALDAFERDRKILYRTRCSRDKWTATASPSWNFSGYEFSPVPVPRELWANVYSYGYTTYATAAQANKAAVGDRLECVHYREVMDED